MAWGLGTGDWGLGDDGREVGQGKGVWEPSPRQVRGPNVEEGCPCSF